MATRLLSRSLLRVSRLALLSRQYDVLYRQFGGRLLNERKTKRPGDKIQCWQCGLDLKETSIFFCDCARNVILPPPDRNYFALLDRPVSFDVDLGLLRRRYRQLMTVLHPDIFVKYTKEEQDYAAAQSSQINLAYKTLLNPLKRGLYMLYLEGLAIEEDEKAMHPEFLEEVMEMNELLDDVKAEEEVLKFQEENNAKINNCTEQIQQAFDAGNLTLARDQLCRLKFFVNLEEGVKAKLLGER